MRRIRVHLVKRTDFQHPRRTDHTGEHADRITALAQGHHRIAFRHAAALIFVHVGLVEGHQVHIKAEPLGFFYSRQALRLLGHREAHQFVGQQVNSRARQLFADLLHFAGEHPLLLITDQAQHPRGMRPGLLHQHLATLQLIALAQVQLRIGQRAQFQRDSQQTLPHRQGTLALDGAHGLQVIAHQREGAVGQTLAVLAAAHLVEQVQGQYPKQRDQDQRRAHAAVDAQEDRVHSGMSAAASGTNR
ncbi:hypothetical protein PS682_05602 [Pseudomonas fluorescens]|nr:hypothetical protein PS682_05602 [Pseudomonas fluorescens]